MNNTALKRSLNLPLLTLYGLGTILGAGIYVLVGKVAGIAGMYTPFAFLLAAVLAAFTGYSYARLSVRFPRSAGEALYVSRAFSNATLSSAVGWMVILTGTVSAATIASGFVGYLSEFIVVPDFWASTVLIVMICALACWGITESVSVAAIITTIEVVGLLLVLWVLGDEFSKISELGSQLLPPLDKSIWVTIFLGAFLAFYAFIGFEDMVNVTEEVINPTRTMPLAILGALTLSSALYILVSLAAVLTLPLDELSASDSPMVSLLEGHNQLVAMIVGFISIIAVVNGALVQVIMGARVLYGMGCQGLAPGWFAAVFARTQTPIRATVLIALAVWILTIGFPLVTLAKLTSFIILIVFAMVNASLVVVRLRESQVQGRLPIDILLPAMGTLLCMGFLLMQLVNVFGGGVAATH